MTKEEVIMSIDALKGIRLMVSGGDCSDCWLPDQAHIIALLEVAESLILKLAAASKIEL